MGRRKREDEPERIQFAIVWGRVTRRLRTEQNLSMKKMAAICQIDPGTVCRYESGGKPDKPLHKLTTEDIDLISKQVRIPDLLIAYKIASALGHSLDEIMALCLDDIKKARRAAAAEAKK